VRSRRITIGAPFAHPRQRLLAVAPLFGALLLGACGDGAGGAGNGEVVNIGYTGPLSGGAAFYGRNVLDGITMAVDEINEAGGVRIGDRQVRLNIVTLDDRYLPNETATNVRRLLQQSRTPVITIPHSGGIQAAQGMIDRGDRFLLSAYSSEPRVLEANNPLTFMVPPRYDGYAQPFVQTTLNRFGPRLGLIPTTTAYGRAWTDVISEEWRQQGGQILGNHGVDYNTTTDYSGAVTRALAERPDVLFIGGPSQPTALVIQAAREQGFRGGFIIMDQAKFEEMDDIIPVSMLEGSVGVHPTESYPSEGSPMFIEAFRRKFGNQKTPTSEIALNYQAIHLIAQAMSLAGTATDPEAIRRHLPEAAGMMPVERTPYGLQGVSPEGHMLGEVVAAHVEGGLYVPLPIPREVQ
jgi:branched-chain amino acid transport system substrate-binding protein